MARRNRSRDSTWYLRDLVADDEYVLRSRHTGEVIRFNEGDSPCHHFSLDGRCDDHDLKTKDSSSEGLYQTRKNSQQTPFTNHEGAPLVVTISISVILVTSLFLVSIWAEVKRKTHGDVPTDGRRCDNRSKIIQQQKTRSNVTGNQVSRENEQHGTNPATPNRPPRRNMYRSKTCPGVMRSSFSPQNSPYRMMQRQMSDLTPTNSRPRKRARSEIFHSLPVPSQSDVMSSTPMTFVMNRQDSENEAACEAERTKTDSPPLSFGDSKAAFGDELKELSSTPPLSPHREELVADCSRSCTPGQVLTLTQLASKTETSMNISFTRSTPKTEEEVVRAITAGASILQEAGLDEKSAQKIAARSLMELINTEKIIQSMQKVCYQNILTEERRRKEDRIETQRRHEEHMETIRQTSSRENKLDDEFERLFGIAFNIFPGMHLLRCIALSVVTGKVMQPYHQLTADFSSSGSPVIDVISIFTSQICQCTGDGAPGIDVVFSTYNLLQLPTFVSSVISRVTTAAFPDSMKMALKTLFLTSECYASCVVTSIQYLVGLFILNYILSCFSQNRWLRAPLTLWAFYSIFSIKLDTKIIMTLALIVGVFNCSFALGSYICLNSLHSRMKGKNHPVAVVLLKRGGTFMHVFPLLFAIVLGIYKCHLCTFF